MLLYARTGQRSAALAQYETYVKLLADELGVEPEAETTILFEQIKSDQVIVSVQSSASKVHLPAMATPFIERSRELARIVERLRQPDCRLLTLVGAGGIGKTRLAVRAAAEIAGDYRDGVYFVGLVAVQQSEFLPAEIANSLNFTLQGGDPRGELIDYLAKRELLLVLDNFEHLVDHAGLIADILSGAPQVQILVTSRVWLNLQKNGYWSSTAWTCRLPPVKTPSNTAPCSFLMPAPGARKLISPSAISLRRSSKSAGWSKECR